MANAAIPGGGGGGDDDNNENDDGSGAKPSVGTIIFASTLLSCALSNLVREYKAIPCIFSLPKKYVFEASSPFMCKRTPLLGNVDG